MELETDPAAQVLLAERAAGRSRYVSHPAGTVLIEPNQYEPATAAGITAA